MIKNSGGYKANGKYTTSWNAYKRSWQIPGNAVAKYLEGTLIGFDPGVTISFTNNRVSLVLDGTNLLKIYELIKFKERILKMKITFS